MQDRITWAPMLRSVTAEPTSVIVPTPSWPRIRPAATAGTSPLRMCRSVPQMVVVSILTMTSVACSIFGSGTSSQALMPGPWYTSAFMIVLLLNGYPGGVAGYAGGKDEESEPAVDETSL